ncbi:MAG TPA: agmatinase [Actinomycetota bacterium]|nr:agmatinase [Actinomycetota bacterium]
MNLSQPGEPSYSGIQTFQKVPFVLDPDELRGVDVVILGAPMDEMVTHRPGARFGPREIRAATDLGAEGWHMDLGVDPFADLNVVDHGDAAVRPGDARFNHRSIREAVGRVVDSGAVPIVLGGDHSISFPNVAAVAEGVASGSLACIHFDAHTDTATENYEVEWSHGTPFRHLVDEGILAGPRLVQIGLRGWWPNPPEWEWARGAGVRWHRMEKVIEEGIDRVVDSALAEVSDADHLFLSVDIDVLDPAFAPGTGTPEPGGMSTRELLRAVRKIVSRRGLVGMDLVEVSPPYDHSGITSMAAHRTVLEAISALALHRSGREARPENPTG